MARHRTKKNRARANERRATKLTNPSLTNTVQVTSKQEEIFGYNPKLIFKDLKKTFLLVVFILLILLSIALIYT